MTTKRLLSAIHHLDSERCANALPTRSSSCPTPARLRQAIIAEDFTPQEKHHIAECRYCRTYVRLGQNLMRTSNLRAEKGVVIDMDDKRQTGEVDGSG